jgi:hypothetical protein
MRTKTNKRIKSLPNFKIGLINFWRKKIKIIPGSRNIKL